MESSHNGSVYTSRLTVTPLLFTDTGEFACADNSTNRSSVYVYVYGKMADFMYAFYTAIRLASGVPVYLPEKVFPEEKSPITENIYRGKSCGRLVYGKNPPPAINNSPALLRSLFPVKMSLSVSKNSPLVYEDVHDRSVVKH